MKAFEKVRDGAPYLSHELASAVAFMGRGKTTNPLRAITVRELQILSLLAEGKPICADRDRPARELQDHRQYLRAAEVEARRALAAGADAHGDPISFPPCRGRASKTTRRRCFDADLESCKPRRRGNFAPCLHRQQDDAKLCLARHELSKHLRPIAAAETDDAVAKARPVLKLVGEFSSRRGVDLDPDVGVGAFDLGEFFPRKEVPRPRRPRRSATRNSRQSDICLAAVSATGEPRSRDRAAPHRNWCRRPSRRGRQIATPCAD